MSEFQQPFGGEHTRRKLDVVAKYLSAYVTVMKKQRFRLFYVDGFAGSGGSASRADLLDSDPALFPTSAMVEGSPLRALSVDPPFDKYLFIEKAEKNVKSLNEVCAKFPDRNYEVWPGDANEKLQEFCEAIKKHKSDRAVVFLDPFGLSVEWDTICDLASTEKVDLWYLVPVDGMSRQRPFRKGLSG